ncbi:MAG: aminotransferase class I/II-fold pyridoxal phosphate-dependent enzyme [Pseudomonadota bacterium]
MEVKETVIRLMTRLAIQHDAVNLSQGFTDEAPIYDMVWGAISATLGGTPNGIDNLDELSLGDITELVRQQGFNDPTSVSLKEVLGVLQNRRDQFNQYSFPFGLPELRHAIANYTETFLRFRPDENDEITVVLGASEGMAATFRAVCEPGDAVAIIQPFHEIYPAQLAIFGIESRFVTLREDVAAGTWRLDLNELDDVTKSPDVKALIFNAPHNPTGKVFDRAELEAVADICKRNDLTVITDEIYEHMVFDGHRHRSLRTLDGMAERTVVVNSISKTGRATGWRVGWLITPRELTQRVRAIHDNLAVQAPTPLQKGAVRLLSQDRGAFDAIAAHYLAKREQLLQGIRSAGFRASAPEGAYYLFADYTGVSALGGMTPTDAAMHLITEYGVATVPGDNFYRVGNDGDRYLRFAFCRGAETLEEGVRRLGALSA